MYAPGCQPHSQGRFLHLFLRRVWRTELWLDGAGHLQAAFNLFNGWALLLDGVVGFYAVIATVSNSLGMKPPFGKPFVQPR